jgi:hypothetical protein
VFSRRPKEYLACEEDDALKNNRIPTRLRCVMLMVATVVGLSAAVQGAQGNPASGQLIAIPLDEAPPEVVMVISAIVLELRGAEQPKGDWPEVVFAPAVVQGLQEPRFRYEGFRLLQAIVNEYRPPSQIPGRAGLKGHLHFVDGIERRTLVAFEADYRLTRDSITVEQATATPMYTYRPEVRLLVVPAERIDSQAITSLEVNARTLEFVFTEAVPVSQPEVVPKGVRDYYVFACFMDRLAPYDRTELVVSSEKGGIWENQIDLRSIDGIAGSGCDVMHLDHNGWHVVIARGEFSLTGEELFFKALFQPVRRRPRLQVGEPVIAGLFSTKRPELSTEPMLLQIQRALAARGYDPGPADGVLGSKTVSAIQAFQRDERLVADGTPSQDLLAILEAPGRPSAVKLAQLGLLLHGYNPGVADGKMGDKTRNAIRAFQRNHGLPADGQLRAQLLSQITGLSGALGESAESSEAMGTSAGGVDWKRKMWPNSIQR